MCCSCQPKRSKLLNYSKTLANRSGVNIVQSGGLGKGPILDGGGNRFRSKDLRRSIRHWGPVGHRRGIPRHGPGRLGCTCHEGGQVESVLGIRADHRAGTLTPTTTPFLSRKLVLPDHPLPPPDPSFNITPLFWSEPRN